MLRCSGLGRLAQLPMLQGLAPGWLNGILPVTAASTASTAASTWPGDVGSLDRTGPRLSAHPPTPPSPPAPTPTAAPSRLPPFPQPSIHFPQPPRHYSTTPPCSLKSLVAQTFPRPAVLPKFKRLPKNPGDIKWRRMVLRFPPEVDATLRGHTLTITGRAGSVKVDLKHMDPTGTVGIQFFQESLPGAEGQVPVKHTLMLCVSPTRHYFRGIATHIDNQIHGVLQGYLVGISLKGVGYRFEPIEQPVVGTKPYFDTTPQEKQNVSYPVQRALHAVRLKVGYTFTKVVPLPADLRAFIVRPTLMYIYGLERHRVMNQAMHIRDVQPPNPFTGNGIRLATEEVKLRPRGGSK